MVYAGETKCVKDKVLSYIDFCSIIASQDEC